MKVREARNRKLYARNYSIKNRNKIYKRHALWKEKNREEINKKDRIYRKERRKKKRDQLKELGLYRPRKRGGISLTEEYRKNYYKTNKGKFQLNQKIWRSENIEKASFYKKSYYFKKRQNGSHTLLEWQNVKAIFNWTCPSCYKTEPEIKLEADHIVPISKGGSDNIENIQPLCRSCNASKSAKTIRYESVQKSVLQYV